MQIQAPAKASNTHTNTQTHTLDDTVVRVTLLASCQGDTPPERVRKQTAHNIIGISTTCQRRMTCPVSLETSLHPITISCTGVLSEWMESCDWSVTAAISEGSESFNGNFCRLKKQLLLGVVGGGVTETFQAKYTSGAECLNLKFYIQKSFSQGRLLVVLS